VHDRCGMPIASCTLTLARGGFRAICLFQQDSELSGDIDSVVASVSKGEIPAGLLEKVKATLAEKRKDVKPWHQFADVRRAKQPKNFNEVTSRVSGNISKYSSNYFFIWLALVRRTALSLRSLSPSTRTAGTLSTTTWYTALPAV
jgi:hypothetical protein